MTDTPRWLIIFAFGVLLLVFAAVFTGQATAGEDTKNQVADWCDNGVKHEPVDTPFIVPEPPSGTVWTLLVLKAGTTNETVPYPVAGDSYAHSEHDNSHIILCWEESSDTTTTSTTVDTTTTTTSSIPTTTVPKTTTTTEPTTTTTAPVTTTSSSTTTSVDPTTTSTSVDPSTTTVPSTVPQTTSTVTTSSTLPVTGVDTGPLALAGLALVLLGSLSLVALRAIGFGRDAR